MFSWLFVACTLVQFPAGFSEATTNDFERYSELSDQYVVSESELGDFIVAGNGELADSDVSSLAIVQFSFQYGKKRPSDDLNQRGTDSDIERVVYFHQPVLAEVRDQRDFSGVDLDCIRLGDKYWMQQGDGVTEVKRDDFLKLHKTSQCFHPLVGPFLTAHNLGQINGFRPKIFNQSLLRAVRRDSKTKRETYLLVIPGTVEIQREIDFVDSKPVAKRDYWKNPTRQMISKTTVKWSDRGQAKLPVEFEFEDSQSGSERSIRITLDWKIGKQVDRDFFRKENLGRSTLGD